MNKWFIKFNNIASTISKKIIIFFLTKNIFPLILLPWSDFGRRRWRFLDFKGQSRAISGLFPNNLVEWQRTSVLVLLPLKKFVHTNFIKIVWTNDLLNLRISRVQSQKKYIYILSNKKYFPSDSFALIALWKTTMTFSWFQRSIEGHKWLIPEWPCWMTKNECISSFAA